MRSTGIKQTTYLDKTTGEFNKRVQHVDLQFTDEGYLWLNRKTNVKTFVEVPLSSEFTWSEKGRINELKHYILKDNQFLVYRSGNFLKPLTTDEMCKKNVLDLSKRQCQALIKKMKSLKIIKEISFSGITYFAFNPLYGFKGKRLSLTVFMFFQDELMPTLPAWVMNKFSETAVELRPMFKVIE